MHEVVYLNEMNVKPQEFESGTDSDIILYLDYGASNHMTGNESYFKDIDETILGKVRFGDDSRIDIKGNGFILFITESGSKKILADVYFIPELKSNIISLDQATESGCEVRMKEHYLMLHDKDGKLITKKKRSRNRLYKVLMDITETRCLNVTVESESARWHARLGDIGMDTIKTMIRRELVIGVPHINVEKETCEYSLLGKQSRHVLPKATQYRAQGVLELIHGDFCGPIAPPSTAANNRYIFVLIDDHSRYMWTILLKRK